MTEWAWVAIGYGVAGTALSGYVIALLRGAAAVRDRAAGPVGRSPR